MTQKKRSAKTDTGHTPSSQTDTPYNVMVARQAAEKSLEELKRSVNRVNEWVLSHPTDAPLEMRVIMSQLVEEVQALSTQVYRMGQVAQQTGDVAAKYHTLYVNTLEKFESMFRWQRQYDPPKEDDDLN